MNLLVLKNISGKRIAFRIFNNFKSFSSTCNLLKRYECNILIVGGGSGGCALAAKLSNKLGKDKVVVLDPAENHYYQPMFTLIGGGMKQFNQSYRAMQSVLPTGAKWIKDKAVAFDLNSNEVSTESGKNISYDMLLVASGLQLNYNKVAGLERALSLAKTNVCSIYSPKYVNRTYETLQRSSIGNAIFTFPASPVKCPGAPQKIMYIADHYFRKTNKRRNMNIIYNTSLPVLFGVKHYADALWKVAEKRDLKVNLKRNLIEVKPESNIAVFENLENPQEKFEENYSFLHVVPPMSAPVEIATCGDLVNELGFVNVSKDTLQHLKYKNVFSIGDCSATPNSKTAASVAAQAPIVFENMISTLAGKNAKTTYDGYASCPLVTGYNSCILAEFDYSLTPLETFPFPQNKERFSMFLLKSEFMPLLYWNVMLKGYWNGPKTMRNMLSVIKFNNKVIQ